MSNDIITKIKSTADLLGGEVFFATEAGHDPEITGVNDLLPNGMYIRLRGSDNSVAYISAFEIDNALSIISQMSMGKANQSEVNELKESLNDKVSSTEFELAKSDISGKASKVEFELLSNEVDTKASQRTVDSLIAQLNNKVDKSSLDSLSDTVSTKVDKLDFDTLSEEVSSKAEQEEVDAIIEDIKTLQDAVILLTNSDAINKINAQIESLTAELQQKVGVDNIADITSSVQSIVEKNNELDNKFNTIESNLSKKANTTYVQGQISQLNTAITGLATLVDSKADNSSVSNKANKADVTSLTSEIVSIKEKVRELDEIECENSSSIAEITSTITAQSKNIIDNKTNINSLKNITDELDNKLEQKWVRVLSTKEYNRLLDNPPEGTYSNYYKYPNTVYLVIDFNKPKAIYIGDILIAKAQQNGSIGFAYTFPIVF